MSRADAAKLRPSPPAKCQALSLLRGLGLIAKARDRPSAWCSTTRHAEYGVCRIRLIMRPKLNASPPQAFAAVFNLAETVAQNWG